MFYFSLRVSGTEERKHWGPNAQRVTRLQPHPRSLPMLSTCSRSSTAAHTCRNKCSVAVETSTNRLQCSTREKFDGGEFFFTAQRPELSYKDIILLQAPMNHPKLLPSFDVLNSLSISVLDCKTSSLSSCDKHIILIILLVYTNLWEN